MTVEFINIYSDMKKTLLFLVLLLTGGVGAMAYDFEIDGLCYTKIPCGELICTSYQVTLSPNPNGYRGDVVVPAMVHFDGVDYEVLRIGANAFEGCTELTSVTVHDGYLAMVAYNAFRNCPNLRKVDLPASLNVLDDNIFTNSPQLDTVVLRSTTPPVPAFNDPFDGLNDHAVVVVRCGCREAYQADRNYAGLTIVDDCNNPLAIEVPDAQKRGLRAWPNPAVGRVTVEASSSVGLFDLAGRELSRQNPTDGQSIINLQGLLPGVYLLRSGAETLKLVVR